MNWKIRFRELTGWRPKNDVERTKDGGRSSQNYPRECFGRVTEAPRRGFSSRKRFFFTNFKWSQDTRRAERSSSTLLPLFIGKCGRSLPPSLPRQPRLLPPEATAFWRNILEGPSGYGFYCTPFFLLNTPLFAFLWYFFRNVTKLYEFRNDTYFLSVRLRNLTDHVFTLF